ncbi:MAG: hypothetical protein QM767_23885 [Anaeromyxobacter sp.]
MKAFAAARFQPLRRLADLPQDVRVAVDAALQHEPLADAGEDWNPTCLVNEDLPGQHLLFAGGSKDLWFIYIEIGGYGLGYHVYTFRRAKGRVILEGDWSVSADPVASIDALQTAVLSEAQAAEFRDR